MNKKRLIAIIMSIALILPVIPANVAMADTGEYVYKGETWKYGLGEAIGYNQGAYKTIGTTGNANWRDASASGNGELAFLESCDPNEDVFILTNTKIVQDTTSIYDAPEIASSMDIIRTTTINKTSYNWLNIINAYAQEQYGVNWGTTWPRPCHPGGQLRIKNNDYTSENAQIYNRYNNYETAEVGAQWKNADKTSEWERRSFVSRSDDVIVTQIEADQDLNITLSMDALTSIQGAPSSGIATSHILEADDNGYAMGFVGKYAIRNRIGTKNVEETRFSHGGWGTATRIVADGATFTEGTISGRPALTITGAKSVMLITKVDRQDSGCDTVDDVKAQCYDRLLGDIDSVVSKYKAEGKFTYENMLAPHAAIHGAEFNKVRLDLCKTDAEKADRQLTNSELITKQSTEKSTFNKAYMERAYYTGRYALLCSSGYHTARLGGIWNGMWSPDWSGDFTLDANVNLQVSGMDTGNMPIADWGYMSLILRVLPDWAENAKNIYGADDAILSGPRTDGTGDANSFHFLGGYPQLFVNGITDWMLMPLYEYWSCYGNKPVPVNKDVHPEQIAAVLDLSAEDIARVNSTGYFDFEKDILFPVLDKNMNFWMQFADERYYKDGNGVNHANDGTTLSEAIAAGDTNAKYIFAPGFSPENTPGGGNVCSFNVTMDVSAAKNSVYMATSVADAVYPGDPAIAAKKAQWADFGSKVPAYIYNDNGSLKEWLDPSLRDNNSHRHTSHAYAAWPGHEAMTDPVLAAGIQQALNDRYSYNATAPESHAHDHRALVEARLGNAEQLETPLRFLSNMTSANSNYRYQSFLTSHNSNLSSGFVTDLACSYSGIINESLAYSYDGEIKILPALLKDLNKGSISGMMARCRAQLDEITWDRGAGTASVTITSQKDNNAIKLMCGVPWKKASINGAAQTIKTDALGNAYIDINLNNNKTVKVDFALADTTLSSLKVNGVQPSNFSPDVYNYDMLIPDGMQMIPRVVANAKDADAKVVIEQPSAVQGKATVTVTCGTGKSVYTVSFASRTNDGFDAETVGSQWQWLREDPATWSLTSNPGFMTISPRTGDLQTTTNTAKNVLLQDAPGDWTVESKLTFSIKPATNYQQGGIIAYMNDDNYIKLAWQNSSSGQFIMQRELNRSASTVATVSSVNNIVGADNTVWFRIKKEGNTYTGYYSVDGMNFTLIGTTEAALSDVKAGLVAFNRTGTTTDLDVSYDYFNFVGDLTNVLPDEQVAILKDAVAALTKLKDPGTKSALSDKLDQALTLFYRQDGDKRNEAIDVLDGFIVQVNGFVEPKKITAAEAADLTTKAQELISNISAFVF